MKLGILLSERGSVNTYVKQIKIFRYIYSWLWSRPDLILLYCRSAYLLLWKQTSKHTKKKKIFHYISWRIAYIVAALPFPRKPLSFIRNILQQNVWKSEQVVVCFALLCIVSVKYIEPNKRVSCSYKTLL